MYWSSCQRGERSLHFWLVPVECLIKNFSAVSIIYFVKVQRILLAIHVVVGVRFSWGDVLASCVCRSNPDQVICCIYSSSHVLIYTIDLSVFQKNVNQDCMSVKNASCGQFQWTSPFLNSPHRSMDQYRPFFYCHPWVHFASNLWATHSPRVRPQGRHYTNVIGLFLTWFAQALGRLLSKIATISAAISEDSIV